MYRCACPINAWLAKRAIQAGSPTANSLAPHLLLRRLALFILAASPAVAAAEVIESWQFSEAAGALFSDLVNDVGSAGWTGNKLQVAADGTGSLAFTQGFGTSDNVFRSATLSSPNQTTGTFELEFSYAAATLAGGDVGGANVGFGMREVDTNTNLFLIRLHRTGGELRLQSRIGSNNVDLIDFNATSLPDVLTVRAAVNLDTDLLNVFTRLGGGPELPTAIDVPLAAPDLEFDAIRIAANTNTVDWGAVDVVKVDYLTVARNPTPPVALALDVNLLTGALTIKNESAADIAIDFYQITSDHSLDPLGWSSLHDQDLPGFPAGDGLGNGWEELGLLNPAADFNVDGIVDADDYDQWQADLGVTGNSDADGDADTDGVDFLFWQRQLTDTTQPNSGLLAESYLTGHSQLNAGSAVSLGSGFQVGGDQDLTFQARLADGTMVDGTVRYLIDSSIVAAPEPALGAMLAGAAASMLLSMVRRRRHG